MARFSVLVILVILIGITSTATHGINTNKLKKITPTPTTTAAPHETNHQTAAAPTKNGASNQPALSSVKSPGVGLSDATPLPHLPQTLSHSQLTASETAIRLLLNQESHMAEAGPRLLFWLLKFIGYTLLLALFILWWYQSSLLYLPSFGRAGEQKQVARNTKGFRSPSEYGLPYEECWIDTEDGHILHAWLVLQPEPSHVPTIIFFHGNAGNIGYRLPNAKSLYYTCRCNLLMVDYRGYGHSSGEPSEHGLRMDALATLKFLRHDRLHGVSSHASSSSSMNPKPEIDLSKIYIFGRSLGGAVAIAAAYTDQVHQDLASRSSSSTSSHSPHPYPPIAGLLIENTFCTLVEMVLVLASRFGLFTREPSVMLHTSFHARILRAYLTYFLTNHWDTHSVISHLRTPMLFLSGLADELIPSQHMAGLYQAAYASQHKQLFTVESGTHNDTFVRGGMEYYETIAKFIQKTSEAHSPPDGQANSMSIN